MAISIANIAGAAALLVLLRRRLGRLELGETAGAVARHLAASVVLAAIAFAVWWVLDEALGRGFFGQVLSLGSALVLGGAAYVGAAAALGAREVTALLSLRARLRRG